MTGKAGTDRSLEKIAHTATERVSGVPKGKFCLRSRASRQRGSSAGIWARPVRPQDEAVEARMRRVRITCLSRADTVRSDAAAAVNGLPEDDGEERVLVVHDGCQTTLVRGSLRRSASAQPQNHVPDAGGAIERPRSATEETAAFRRAQGHRSSPAAACRQPEQRSRSSPLRSASEGSSAAVPRSTAPRISTPRGPGWALRVRDGKRPLEGLEAVSVAPARTDAMSVGRPPTTKATTIHGNEREAKA